MFRPLIFSGIISFILLFTQCGKENDIVAKVENEEITVEEFKKVLESQFKTTDLSTISSDLIEKTLNELVDQKLKVVKAKTLGLDQNPQFLNVKKEKEEQLIYQKLVDIDIIDKFVPNDLLKKYFEWQKSEVSVTSIIIGDKGTVGFQGNRSRKEAEKIAIEVLESLKSTDDPGEIAVKYSDDPTVKRNEGKIDSYPIGQFGPYADEDVFTANKDEVVGPFPVHQGFAIFKILSKKERVGKSDFEKTTDQLRQKLYQSYFLKQANEKHRQLTIEFLKKYHAEIISDNIFRFLNVIEEWSKIKQHNDSSFTQVQRKIPIAKINEKTISIGDIIDKFQGRFYQFYSRFNTESSLENLIQQLLNWKAWIIEAKNRKLQQNPDIKKEIEEFSNTELIKLFDIQEIKSKVEVSDEEVINQYEKDKYKYFHLEKIQLWEIRVTKQDLANKIAKQARSGENFENLAKKYTENNKIQKTGGYLGYQTRQTAYPETVRRALEAGSHQIVGPFKYGTYYYIIKTGEYVPKQQKKLDEVKEFIRYRIRRNKETDKQKELMEQIRKEFSFQINNSILRSLC